MSVAAGNQSGVIPVIFASSILYLPLLGTRQPVGWADVATEQDLGHLEERMGLRVDKQTAELRTELHRGLRVQCADVVAAARLV